MFRRRAERPAAGASGSSAASRASGASAASAASAASGPALGVGVQVYVLEGSPASGDGWVGEPTGVIVAPGDRGLRSVGLPPDALTSWIVAFSEPQWRRDGRGPFERAAIPAALLVAAEPIAPVEPNA